MINKDISIQQTRSGATSQDRVLFFGRSGCEATQKALVHLEVLGFRVTFVESAGRGESMPDVVNDWQGEYIFCFRSFFILSKAIIDKASVAAINFHPAPVEYPGSGCLNFALYDNASHYGVTAHIMNEKVDNGAIVECRRFPITAGDSVDSLLARTHIKLLDLFLDVVTELAIGGKRVLEEKLKASSDEKWVGEALRMKDLKKLQTIPVDVDEMELKRIIRATYTQRFPPSIYLHGFEFILKSPDQA
ncbi:formyltransferase family protein [Methylophilus methylotrophus]|uniref:formyltransferase family protein n=1 Tax=Methylophilus methylotrophus TaxID=17 RepID=UPI000F5A4D57|nr:formyltransferase family protein [Methylophilus methylotrophus]